MSAAAKPALSPPENDIVVHTPGRRSVLLGLLLVAATLMVYAGVSQNGFVNFDDDRYVVGNAHVRAGITWSTISWAFTSLEQSNWHPLTWISHALDCQIFGINPLGHHYSNVLLHAANALLLFLILRWFTGYTGRSLMVAALFAVHPVNVESVAWVAERKNVLCMFFCLLTIAAYGWYARKPVVGRNLAVAALFAMALMSKPMAITLPFALLLLDYWPLGRMSSFGHGTQQEAAGGNLALRCESFTRLCIEKIPLIALSAGSAWMTITAQSAGGAVVPIAVRPLPVRLENALVCYARYIGKALWPSHLAALYPNPHAVPVWQMAGSAVFLAAVTFAVWKYRERRYLLVGWLWFAGTMVPMIGMVQVGNQGMADRYAYLPFVGVFVMAVWGVAEWASARKIAPQILAAAGATAIAALSVATFIHVGHWHDDLSLWSHTLAVTDQNFVAENNYGAALARQGRVEEAIAHFRTAAQLEPGDAGSRLNLGVYAQQHGDLKQAAEQYEWALRLSNDIPIRVSAYANLGTAYFALREYGRARENFEAAIKLGGAYPVAFLELGLIAQKNGDWKTAVQRYAELFSAQPSDVALLLLSQAFERNGQAEESRRALEQAQRVSGNLAQAQQTVDQLMQGIS